MTTARMSVGLINCTERRFLGCLWISYSVGDCPWIVCWCWISTCQNEGYGAISKLCMPIPTHYQSRSLGLQ
jgi:hypothetical protein